jgi:hypothetical protein
MRSVTTVELNLFLQNILQRRCDMVPFSRLCDPAAHPWPGLIELVPRFPGHFPSSEAFCTPIARKRWLSLRSAYNSPPAGFSGEAMSPKVPSDWRLTWLLLGVIVGLLGLIVIEVVAKRYL